MLVPTPVIIGLTSDSFVTWWYLPLYWLLVLTYGMSIISFLLTLTTDMALFFSSSDWRPIEFISVFGDITDEDLQLKNV